MDIIFTPPVAFALLLISSLATLRFLKRTFAPKGTDSERKGEAYACGQRNMPDHVKPNYSAFIAYAFFFTVMHVLVLLIATVTREAVLWPIILIVITTFVMYLVLRKEDEDDV